MSQNSSLRTFTTKVPSAPFVAHHGNTLVKWTIDRTDGPRMENEVKSGQAFDTGAAVATPTDATFDAAKRHPKPMLTVEQQVAHMKSKGITFDLISEEEAAAHLREKCQFFRVYAYRRNFDRRVGGERDGQYVHLDFGHLKMLSSLDRKLRDVLLAMTLDVEHFAKVRLLSAAEDNGEDGYAIMHEYRASLTDVDRSRIEDELKKRRNDPYAGGIVRKYLGDMPVWAFCEVVPFGIFTDFVRFCASRWNDKDLRDVHYQLKNSRQIRNAGAHGACILNDVVSPSPYMRPPSVLVNAMNAHGIPRRLRTKWLRSRRMTQICSLLYLFSQIAPKGKVRTEREAELTALFAEADSCGLPPENPSMAALLFLRRLTSSLGLLH